MDNELDTNKHLKAASEILLPKKTVSQRPLLERFWSNMEVAFGLTSLATFGIADALFCGYILGVPVELGSAFLGASIATGGSFALAKAIRFTVRETLSTTANAIALVTYTEYAHGIKTEISLPKLLD